MLALPATVWAAPTLIDPGFESPPITFPGFHLFDPTASQSPWTYVGNTGVARSGWQQLVMTPPEGQQVGFLSGGFGSVDDGTFGSVIFQNVTGLTPNSNYAIVFQAICPANDRDINPDRIHVLVDGVEVGAFLPTDSFQSFQTLDFTAGALGTANLAFAGGDPTPAFTQQLSFIDAVSVVPTPEPGCAGLILVSLVLLGPSHRRTRQLHPHPPPPTVRPPLAASREK